jgi:hypothetical protein
MPYPRAHAKLLAGCFESGGAKYNFRSSKSYSFFLQWRNNRVVHELLLHVLDTLGIIQWAR